MINHAVVNSLFSDGCFAAVITSPHQAAYGMPPPPCYLTLHEFGRRPAAPPTRCPHRLAESVW